ncbi:hypothetical protein BH10BAC2_BH10BAC2_07290 [soil metagenome]
MRSDHLTNLIPFTAFFIMLSSCSNNTNNKVSNDSIVITDSTKKITSYELTIPAGWTTERILFPIDFAPQIQYTGVEDLRFANGWGDISSEEHWSYAFLWWLDGKPVITDTALQENLTNYYSGLVKRNITSRSIPAFKVVSTVAKINTATTATGDIATFTGTIDMLNYIAQTPMTLNCIIHIKDCGREDKTAIFFEVSPQKATHDIGKH